jgi:hypothetical protein
VAAATNQIRSTSVSLKAVVRVHDWGSLQ